MANRPERSRSYPEPPANPSDEELSRDWNLSAADRVEVMRSRGSAHRHRFALQLCALRTLGTLIDDVSKLPVRITNHVGRQLGLPPLLFLEDHDRPATATEQAQRIREHLGYRPARKLYADTIKSLPDGVPTQFVAGALRDAITTDGKVNVRIRRRPGREAIEHHVRRRGPILQ